MRRALLLFFVGLSPTWVAFAVMFAAAPADNPSQYWVAAPWIAVASLPVSLLSLCMLLAAFAVHAVVRGPAPRKLRFAAGTYATLLALVVAGAWAWAGRHASHAERLQADKTLVLDFVKAQPAVQRAAGGIERAAVLKSSGRGGLPREYVVSAAGSAMVFAEVEADRTHAAPRFALRCIRGLSATQQPVVIEGTCD